MDVGKVHQDLAAPAKNLNEIFDKAPIALAVIERGNGSLRIKLANQAFARSVSKTQPPYSAVDVFGAAACEEIETCICKRQQRQLQLNIDGRLRPAIICPLSESGSCLITITEGQTADDDDLAHSVALHQREDFVATLTHDLKTPIVGANMVLSALLDGTIGSLSAQQKEIIGKLLISNQALLKMIHNLLEVYRFESGTPLVLAQVDIAMLLKSCAEDIRPLFQNKSQTIEFLFPEHPVLLTCDQEAIQRVFVNLLGNAIKFTPEKGRITTKIEDGENEVSVLIIDTGSGIAREDQPKLFQRFWQGEPGKRYAAGTGLGLYFCHQVVKAHDGTITCTSAPGTGSTFTVKLPKNLESGKISKGIVL